jgi:uncharacterized iron-regulated membrane protein
MSAWQRWLQHPQNTFLRRALFQVHLWVGVTLGVYIFVMCVSGTILIYRVQLARRFSREPVLTGTSNPRLSPDELKAVAQQAYPGYEVSQVYQRRKPSLAVGIVLDNGQRTIDRLFNPFTGQDVGSAVTRGFLMLQWIVDFHDDLLSKPTGRIVNGLGAILSTILALTGAIIWWPGSSKWRRRITFSSKSDRARVNFALHNALGFWSFGFVFMWGISGIYLCFPDAFNRTIDYFDPNYTQSRELRFPDKFLAWLAQAHFGRFGGIWSRSIWTVFGVLPIVLFVTGMLMWWHRVLRPAMRRGIVARAAIKEAEPEAATDP